MVLPISSSNPGCQCPSMHRLGAWPILILEQLSPGTAGDIIHMSSLSRRGASTTVMCTSADVVTCTHRRLWLISRTRAPVWFVDLW